MPDPERRGAPNRCQARARAFRACRKSR
jgi:hypothetical protein